MRLQKPIAVMVLLAVLLVACGPMSTQQAPAVETEEPSPGDTSEPPEDTAESPSADRPLAALVNAQPIYLADYERQVAQYEAAMVSSGVDFTTEEGQARLLQAREDILNSLIEQVLIEQYAAAQGIVVADADVDAALEQIVQDIGGDEEFEARIAENGLTRQEVWNDLRAQLIGSAVIEQVTASVPESAEHVHARHILVSTSEEAERLLAQLQMGADFAELARTYSEDESTGQASGDLGFFPRGVLMAPEVEDVAFALQPGQISTVVASSFGFHIVEVVERDPSRALSPENLQHLRERAFQDWIETLWATADVERFVGQGS